MGYMFFIIVLSLAVFALCVVGSIILQKKPKRRDWSPGMDNEPPPRRKPKWTLSTVIGLVFFAITMVFSSYTVVSPSRVGVVNVQGTVSPVTLSGGPHLVVPWARVTEVFIGMDVATVQGAQAGTRDLQSVHTDLTVNFFVDPSKALLIYGFDPNLNYLDNYVKPAIQEVFKAVVSHYTAEELITKRDQVSDAMSVALRARLVRYGFNVRDINVTNFKFSPEFDQAIEQKVMAGQNAEKAQRDLERIKFEAEQKVAAAEGEAKAIQIQSQAIQQNGGQAYLQLQFIQHWNGTLPTYWASSSSPMTAFTMPAK